ncbi:MAG: hypothetical protein ACJARY_003185 [Candidatus Azotimanducaceae bacterium]
MAKASLAIVLFFGGSQVASAAAAGLSADHIIRNTAAVNYADAGGIDQAEVTSSVDITINLVAATPTVEFNIAESTTDLDALSVNQLVTLAYEIFSNANGTDNYTFTVAGLTGDGYVPTSITGTTLDLAATVASSTVASTVFADETDGTAAGTAIVVASDGTGGDGELNGFIVGDFVKVGLAFCVVNGITEPAGGAEANATSTLYVDLCKDDFSSTGPTGGDSTAGALAIGDSVGEIQMVFLTTTPTAAGTLDFTVTIGDTLGDAAIFDISDQLIAFAPDLKIRKFVRNITTGANNPADACNTGVVGGCVSVDGVIHFATGVTANPGEQLQYAILLYNNGGLTTEILVTDVDVAFTTYDDDSTSLLAKSASTSGVSCATATDDVICTVGGSPTLSTAGDDALTGAGNGFASYATPTLTVAAGHDGATGAEAPLDTEIGGGQIYAGEASVVTFTVTID